jgi:hypothetical protein
MVERIMIKLSNGICLKNQTYGKKVKKSQETSEGRKIERLIILTY